MKKIIGYVKFNNNKYKVFSNNEEIFFSLCDNKRNLFPEEISILKETINHMVISANPINHIYLMEILYKGNTYQMYLDKVSGFNFFYEYNNGELKLSEDMELFNQYNSFILSKKHSKAYKTKLFIAKGFFYLTLTIGSIMIVKGVIKIFPDQTIGVFDKAYGLSYQEEINNGKPLKYDDIVDAINSNPNLSLDEKKFILENKAFFEDNFSYMGNDFLIKRLTKLDSKFYDYRCPDRGGEIIDGKYTPTDYKIRIYNASSFEECNKETYRHEFYHSFTANFKSIGKGLREGTNELFCQEYGVGEKTSYSVEVTLVKALAEIIGNESFRYFQFSGDINYIVDALKNILNDEDFAYKLIGFIDTLNNEEYKYSLLVNNEDYNSPELEECNNNYNNALKNITIMFERYYNEKYNRDIHGDLVMSYYLNLINASGFSNEFANISERKQVTTGFKKSYFNTNNEDYLNGILDYTEYPRDDEFWEEDIDMTYDEVMAVVSLGVNEDGKPIFKPNVAEIYFEDESYTHAIKIRYGQLPSRHQIIIDENNRYIVPNIVAFKIKN